MASLISQKSCKFLWDSVAHVRDCHDEHIARERQHPLVSIQACHNCWCWLLQTHTVAGIPRNCQHFTLDALSQVVPACQLIVAEQHSTQNRTLKVGCQTATARRGIIGIRALTDNAFLCLKLANVLVSVRMCLKTCH